ncbi:MAG: hypothetical protein KAW01_02055 [Deltaproteobacteria bacterium]|nr:hypothetical protein [Deltaproteobacteria bacterium]
MTIAEKFSLNLTVVIVFVVFAVIPVLGSNVVSSQQKPVVEFKLPPYRVLDVAPKEPRDRAKVVGKSDYCIDCHRQETPGIFEEWVGSGHARLGIGCNDCHGAYQSDKDSFLHAGRYYIRTIVSPVRCGRCHEQTIRGFGHNAHAKALTNLEEMQPDDPRYPLIEPYKESGFTDCRACHGSRVVLGEDHRPTPETWPNSGAGRINPDKSPGNCSICHGRHRFSAATARQPEACLGCHDGRLYPEGDIYRHSPHGLAYADKNSRHDLERPYFYCDAVRNTAPTCAFCHFGGAGLGQKTRHDPTWRLPRHLTHPEAGDRQGKGEPRERMMAGCQQCHAASVIRRFFTAADAELERYQQEEVAPVLAVYVKKLKKAKGKKRQQLLADYADFLARAKEYRLNLYMGRHGCKQR